MKTLPMAGTSLETETSILNEVRPPYPVLEQSSSTGPVARITEPSRFAPEAELPPILIADDDADDVFFLQRLIRRTGVKNRLITFEDGTEVVNYLGGAQLAAPGDRRRCPRLLFLDLKMVGLGGFGFLEWARQQKELSPLVIVVLSNSNAPDDVNRAMALGAHRYLVKYPCVQTITTIVRSVYPVSFSEAR